MSWGRNKDGRYLDWAGREVDDATQRHFELRESGYTGWIDQDGHKVSCPSCGQRSCTAGLGESCDGDGAR
jgi:hypothetical protein